MKQSFSSSPPATTRRGGRQRSRWLGLLMMYLFSMNLYASMDPWGEITQHPTLASPWGQIRFRFYNETNSDSFFLHNATEGSTAGPAIYIDGRYVCSPDWELAWPGSNNTGNNSGLDDERGNNGWWGNTYNKTVDNIGYSVRFWDPEKTGGTFSVQIVSYIWNLELDKKHVVTVKGHWKTNNVGTYLATRNFTLNAISSPFSAPTGVKMTDYNHFSIDGTLNASYGPTYVGTTDEATGKSYIQPERLTYSTQYAVGTGSFSGLSLSINRDNYYDAVTKPVEYVLKRSVSNRGNFYLYKWYDVTIPGFVRAKNIRTETNIWNKQITLSWDSDESENRSKEGTWRIYRRISGSSDWSLLSTDLTYTQRSFTDNTDISYDTEYEYKIIFIPKNSPSGMEREELSQTVIGKLARSFDFSNLVVSEDKEDKIVLSWSHTAFANASSSPYTLIVERSTDDPNLSESEKTWTEVYRTTINSKSVTTGSFEDTGNLVAFQDYSYRLKTTVFDKDYISSPVTGHLAGMSYVTDFSASRGTYSSMVKLKWTTKQVGNSLTYYDLQRRPLGSTNDDDWITLSTISGTASSYSYDDVTALPGSYNQYRIVTWLMHNDERKGNSTTLTDGFSVATGIISGRVTYGTGTAVEGVRVTLKQNNADGKPISALRSLRFSGTKAGMSFNTKAKTIRQLFGSDFSVQLYVSPSMTEMGEAGTTYTLFDADGIFAITMTYDADAELYKLGAKMGNTATTTALGIPSGEWRHVSCVYDKATSTTTLYIVDADTLQQDVAFSGQPITLGSEGDDADAKVSLAYLDDAEQPTFKGYVDEFRVFTKALAENDILRNYNHLLSGSETALAIYWPFDEGLTNQSIAYDFSKTNNVGNGRHGLAQQAAASSTYVPDEGQLSLMGYTNEQGTYEVRGIPFSGEGTSYTITPTMGIHQFSPAYDTRFVNMSMLNHSAVNFEDVSSFPAKGVVFYENTTIPVPEAYLYVDGTMASKDGEPIMTDSKGEFTVSVPIGDHFIQVKKTGHTFLHDGRYPYDPNNLGLRHTFEQAVSNLTFTDQTLVTVAGRVAGGNLENEKPLGLANGCNNIGKAQLRLELSNPNGYLNVSEPDPTSTTSSYDISPQQRDFSSLYGKAYVPGGKNYITVETDPVTGEWVAQLPPLRYDVTEAVIPSNSAITKADFSLPVIDATNPNITHTDSIETPEGYQKFVYHASAKMMYKAPSTIEVSEHDDGHFGMDSYEVKDINGTKHEVPLYDAATGSYTFSYPVYRELDTYHYNLYAYERYANYDADPDNPVVSEVPLAGKVVTIKNQFASTTAVSKEDGSLGDIVDDKLELNAEGRAKYHFRAGFPNIQSPYTRGLSISYDNDGTEMSWSGNNTFKAIVVGGLPTGNNFVTQGPDEVLMVLRDPPGSHSQTTWSKGTTVTQQNSYTNEFHSDLEITSSIYAGVVAQTGTGVGFMVINEQDTKATFDIGAEHSAQRTSFDSHEHTLTTTKDISTSDAMDFVGAPGDVFIGSAKNIIFGACRAVDIKWNNATGQAELVQEDAMSTGEEFTTGFAYTQNYIKEVLIPNFKALRNDLLTPVASTSGISRPAKGEDPIYVTTLSKDDAKFGTSNNDNTAWGNQAVPFAKLKNGIYSGPSYTMLLPMDYENDKDGLQDMVNFYNMQIKRWERELYKNEEAKVTAINNREKWLRENHSFDAGASITMSVAEDTLDVYTDTDVDEINAVLGTESGYRFSGVGLALKIEEKIGRTFVDDTTHTSMNSEVMSYTLMEDGDDDYLSVDVFNAPDGFSPIFVTRGGATSCPYEDAVKTEYYQPGTVIMNKTVQIEKPEIEAQTQLITGIPAGGTGTFKVNIRNNSETGEDLWFDLLVTPDSNPDGLSVMMDDTGLNYGTSILVKAGETMVKTISVSQTNPDILSYENVKIRIASQCQKDNTSTFQEIADTTEFSVFFQPSCSDIHLASSHTLVNDDTETPVTLSMSGYNYSMASLKGIRLQYKGANDADFRTLQEYSKDAERVAADPNLLTLPALEGTNKLNFIIDLRSDDFADKTYVFRAITVCDQGGVEVNNESEEITIIRDMTAPMLMATPSPSSGVLGYGDDLLVTFNEDIQSGILTKPNNFDVTGVLNEGEVAHDVALSLSGNGCAKTQTTVDLARKSFAFNFWLNYQSDGTLLTHGSDGNNFKVGIADGRLVVSMTNAATTESITSTNLLPKNKWVYLNVSYTASDADDATTPTVSAGYAMDSEDVSLLNNQELNLNYEGNGSICIGGNGLTGKMQELTLWNDARSMAEAQADMHLTKSSNTRGLIGYWQLNEGRGDVATDRARSRHLTLPSENAWWINGANYAVVLDGATVPTVNIGSLNTTPSEDYLIEAWFKADEQQDGVVTVLSTMKMDLRLNANGQMEMLLGNTADANADQATLINNKDMRDGQWHHVAVNVLKSTDGGGTVYIDGKPCKLFAPSAMPMLFGDKLMLGGRRLEIVQGEYRLDQLLKGAIDEVRIWKARRTADVIQENMYNRLTADEAGLVAYYPMETFVRDDYQQLIATATTANTKNTEELLGAYDKNYAAKTIATSSDNTAALKPAPIEENVEFDFVASERQIKVVLNDDARRLEGSTVTVTVKNVMDKNGNKAAPITWSFIVKRNTLNWQETEVELEQQSGESSTFEVEIANESATTDSWMLSGLPAWLTASATSGTLTAQTKKTITFTVNESTAIGKYEQTIYLTGNNNIAEPLTIRLKVRGEEPDWAVNTGDYQFTMSIVGQLQFQGKLATDADDIVAAFNEEGVCLGVARPEYESAFDTYFTMMTLYGNLEDEGQLLSFKAYDASTGKVYPVVDHEELFFEKDTKQGKLTAPFVWNATDKIEQLIALKKGWNWMSLNVTLDDMTPTTVMADALDILNIINGPTSTLEYDPTLGWGGSLTTMDNAAMYKLDAKTDGVASAIGSPANVAATQISVKKEALTWIGYPLTFTLSPNDAFAGLDPEEDDMVKSQSGFSVYSKANAKWVGTLKALEPGKGYMYSSAATSDKTFTYPSTAPLSGAARVKAYVAPHNYHFEPIAPETYPSNMTMIAQVVDSNVPVPGIEVAAFVDGECRATMTSDADGYLFLLVPGDGRVRPMTLRTCILGEESELDVPLSYQTDKMLGSLKSPVRIDITKLTTGIGSMGDESDEGEYYDLSGRKLATRPYQPGVYIRNGEKVVIKRK